MDKENSYMQMVIYMKENGRMIKLTDMVYTIIKMEHVIRDIGKKICNMDLVRRPGQMDQNMKGIIKWGKSMQEEDIYG